MTANVGLVDRMVRAIAGLVLLGLGFNLFGPGLANPWDWISAGAGGVLLLTAIFSVCPAYSLLGIRTCAR
jgi:hypothetical protein